MRLCRSVFDPTVEVFEDQGIMVMETAQFRICGQLQVCPDRSLGHMIIVLVGLLMLQRGMRGMGCCEGAYTGD